MWLDVGNADTEAIEGLVRGERERLERFAASEEASFLILSLGAKAVGVGRYYLFPLAVAGQPGVERALGLMREEIERAMKLMGCSSIAQLSRANLRFR